MTAEQNNQTTSDQRHSLESGGRKATEPFLRSDATIRELAALIITMNDGPMFIDDITDRILEIKKDVKPASVRSEISMLATTDQGGIERVRRGWYNQSNTSTSDDDLSRLISTPLRELVEAAEGLIEEPPGYQSSALALVDAVFSARSRYASVLNVIRHVKAATGWDDGEEFTIEELLKFIWKRLDWIDLDELSTSERLAYASARLRNREESSQRGEVLREIFGNVAFAARTGMTKSELVIEFGLRLLNVTNLEGDLNITLNSKRDFIALTEGPFEEQVDLLDAIESSLVGPPDGVRGIGPATVRYLYLLMGINAVKPDRMLIRWVQGALGGEHAPPSPYRTAHLIEGATRVLQSEGYPWSIRAIDRLIWKVQSGRIPELAQYRLGPVVESGIATRRANSLQETTQFHEGMSVDWAPRNPQNNRSERWHGQIVDLPRAGRVEVEWTQTDSTREFRPGTKIPLRVPDERKGKILAFRERVSTTDLVACAYGSDHPGLIEPPPIPIGDTVYRVSKKSDGTRWKGKVVGTVDARYDRYIVHWTDITFTSDSGSVERFGAIFRVEFARDLYHQPYEGWFDEPVTRSDGSEEQPDDAPEEEPLHEPEPMEEPEESEDHSDSAPPEEPLHFAKEGTAKDLIDTATLLDTVNP